MAASPYRSTVTIDGTKINAISSVVTFSTDKAMGGTPLHGSLKSGIRFFVDFHDNVNVPYATLKKLFELCNVVTEDKIRDIKIEFWRDDAHKDALVSYAFKGWISGFHTCNPPVSTNGSNNGSKHAINHLLVVDLEPALDQKNYADVRVGN